MPPTENRFIRLDDLGVITVTGPDRRVWLQGMLTMDVVEPFDGAARYALVLDGKGRILADLHVVDDIAEDRFWLLVESGRAPTAFEALSRLLVAEDVELALASGTCHVITLQGPGARTVPLVGVGATLAAFPNDRTGTDGLDLLVTSADLEVLANVLTRAGVREASPAELDTWRIEAGVPRWGCDFDDTTIPQEAGLLDALHWGKGCYVGQEVVARLGHRGQTTRELRRLHLDGPVTSGSPIFLEGEPDRAVGRITSAAGTYAIAELRRRAFEPGTVVLVAAGGDPSNGQSVSARVLAERVRGHVPLRPENDPTFKASRPQRGFVR